MTRLFEMSLEIPMKDKKEVFSTNDILPIIDVQIVEQPQILLVDDNDFNILTL
jgi:hypothetical protein